ncbi:hypothetical protein R3X27_25230 [Tropicimonas sp. TH_r6]|uniref:hypothetical protein n=1 Tax=Tropicimonas sp. TH_r6 TaxID=3082085 RepID=UPI00295300DB|nr:hypothetical protein [Tropicimonas sp. TH_r6]MDV7145987.1 hypothetical protein [Tropicimonas sp. TH_r6]
MSRIISLWLISGTVAVLFSVGLINTLPTDGDGVTRGVALWTFLAVCKFAGITASGFFGLYGLLHEYRDKAGKTTRQGRVALSGILASAFLSAFSFILSEIKAADASAARQVLLLKENRINQDLLRGITEVSNKIVIAEASFKLEIVGNISGDVLEFSRDIPVHFDLFTRSQIRDCLEIFRLMSFLVEESSIDDESAEELESIFGHCLSAVPMPGSDIELPSTRVNFLRNPTGEEELGFFRIDPMLYQETALDPVGQMVSIVGTQEAWEYYIDDVPVRYRTNELFSVPDFAGVWLIVQVYPHAYVVADSDKDIAARLTYLDFDTEDGRSVTLYSDDFEIVSQGDFSVSFGFQFPKDLEKLDALFKSN